MPGASSGTSLAGTSAASSMSPRSTIVTSGDSTATFSPGWTWRFATVPASGAATVASLSAFCARRTCASADLTLPTATSWLDRLPS